MNAIPSSNGKYNPTGKEYGIDGEVVNKKPCPCKSHEGKSKTKRYLIGAVVLAAIAIAGYFAWKKFGK